MWLLGDSEFTDDMIGDSYGFVYMISNLSDDVHYVGKKFFYSIRTIPPLKGKTRKRKVKKFSDWKEYWSSSDVVKSEVERLGKESFERKIISLHPNKQETNFGELSAQILLRVLDAKKPDGSRLFYNENIEMKFYPSKVHGGSRLDLHEHYLTLAQSIQSSQS